MTKQRRRIRLALILATAIVVLPYFQSRFYAAANRLRSFGPIPAAAPTPKSKLAEQYATDLRIAAYNIAHGRGLAESNFNGGSPEQRLERLEKIAELLRSLDADVVVLNEVDFDSSWSGGVNQAAFLAREAGYRYRVEERNLDVRFLTWTWRFGNAILSKHPIESAAVIDLPGYSTTETWLAGKKRGLSATINANGKLLQVLGVHLSHRSETLRARSADQLVDIAAASKTPTIIVGDLNSTPSGFPNFQTSADSRNAIDILSAAPFSRHPLQPPVNNDALTFHSAAPKSIIDWILIPDDWQFSNYRVLLSELSDHRPVATEISPPSN